MQDRPVSQLNFFHLLMTHGVKNFFLSVDFIVGAFTLIFMLIAKYYNWQIFLGGDTAMVVGILAAASTLFAITIAALAIILSFSNSDLVKFLVKHDKLASLLFLFWTINGAYLIVIILSFVYLILNAQQYDFIRSLREYLYIVNVSIFVYSIVGTVFLLEAVIKFGLFMGIYEKMNLQKPKNEEK